MATYAIVISGIVDNIILTEDKEQSEIDLGCKLIEYTPENPAGIGWTYDEETGRFTPPEPVDPVNSATQKLIDMGLTQEEIDALINQASQPTLQEPTK